MSVFGRRQVVGSYQSRHWTDWGDDRRMRDAIDAIEPVYYTPMQVAEILNMTVDWVYLRIRAGELASVRLGKYRRISQADLDTYLAGARS